MSWQPLSERQGWLPPDEPYEGVPNHLAGQLVDWLAHVFGENSLHGMHLRVQVMRTLAVRLRVPLPSGVLDQHVFSYLINGVKDHPDSFLDLVDAALQTRQGDTAGENQARALRELLSLGGSVWTVAPNGRALQLAVGEATQASISAATATQDEVTMDLGIAWGKAYGRDPDASDAWDHAIKAVEHVIIPAVIPTQNDGTLGKALGQLRNQGPLYEFALSGNDRSHSVAPLITMLELLWANPDRHGGGGVPPTPTLDASRGVVQVAVAIVQMHRNGWVVRRR